MAESMALADNCNFCSVNDCYLGIHKFIKIFTSDLEAILKEESAGKKQKVGNKLKNHQDRFLRYCFDLGDEFLHEKFNNLALDELRTKKNNSSDLGKLFNMGSGNQTFDYLSAAALLLKRSYPEIENSSQQKLVLIPETFIPSYTKGVDPKNVERKVEQVYTTTTQNVLSFKSAKEEITAFKGTYAERIFYDQIKKEMKSSKVVVLHSLHLMLPKLLTKPGTQSGQRKECDFLIINNELKYILILEIKHNLHAISKVEGMKTSIQVGLDQICKIKTILETFFGNDINIEDWKFVGALGFIKIENHVNVCQNCKPFVIRSTEVKSLLDHLDNNFCINIDDDEDYKLIVRNLLYTIFANPGPIVQNKVDEVTFERIKDQGNYKNVLFWMPSQFDLVQLDSEGKPIYKNVLFASSYSTGKTEVMKGMIQNLLKTGQKCLFMVPSFHQRKPLFLLQLELYFEDKEFEPYRRNIKFSVLNLPFTMSAYEEILQISNFVKRFPDTHIFIDELVLGSTNNDVQCIINEIIKSREDTSLWLAIAGVQGEGAQTRDDFLELFPDFHIPEMKIPLRNSKNILTHVTKDGRKKISRNNLVGAGGTATLEYNIPEHLIEGMIVSEYGPPEYNDLAVAVKEALLKINDRQGKRGITIISPFVKCDIEKIMKGIEQAGRKPPIIYCSDPVDNVSEIEMKNWLRDRGNRDLVTDLPMVKGWEDRIVMVIDYTFGSENMYLRAVANLIVIKTNKIK